MEYAVLGWPPDGPTLRLDYRQFSYAGKFVMSNTGKAVAREGEEIVGAIAFNEDRTDETALWLRYVTVKGDRRGEGIGASLVSFVTETAHERGYDTVKIAVNNPFAYEAVWKAGFGYTGEQTGIAELVCAHPGNRSQTRYQAGLDEYRSREGLSDEEQAFLSRKATAQPPK
ncbi:GNAT family N-acetyltransferase [Haladaptatus sp. DJG-WS-42]|uniref:GNAT family N-acetyltransferase n=1 Tax=Haladaptatus sp. DJG-WS-42 TaxID=3120516 RepID=UPI0030CB4731